MSLFEKKPRLSRSELREKLRKADGEGRINQQDRIRLEREVFGTKYGQLISQRDFTIALRELRQARFRTKDYREKDKLDKQIKLLERL